MCELICELKLQLFPQHQHQRANSDILPFPFEAKAPEASKSVDEYWKRPMSKFQPKYSGLKIPHSPSSALFFDAVTYNFNYSTGWCSIGNITGKTLHDAFASLQSKSKQNF